MDSAMSESTTVLNAQIGFLDTHVALIHIPISLYPHFTHAITRLLLHNARNGSDGHAVPPSRPWQYWHPFSNVSVTPNECSVVCPRVEAEQLFAPLLHDLSESARRQVSISTDDYAVITITGAGLEAGERVLDLTSPLAMAGISIYFITSYWSDFILVPFKARSKVIRALEERGFVFEAEDDGEAGHMTNPASPIMHPHHRTSSSTSSFDCLPSPVTPPPSNVSELQAKTFKTLRTNNVSLRPGEVDLVTCAAVKSTTTSAKAADPEGKLQLGLLKCLTASPPPSFLSLTLTDTESASLTLDQAILPLFADAGEDLLLGKDGPAQVAITLDLQDLPQESTGIVCGVASRLIEGMKGRVGGEVFNMSYLSTARAGHVIVYRDELEDAMAALHGGERNGLNGCH
ncbi:hypothetical protein LTR53_002428 [Teratosphaeriaceae sp. CCFEE 6253]|nr:hypothetical protein LTR53_002428 [Teratosphaeriaceae sp. CCFEE 6253]